MNKNMLYLLATIIALTIVALLASPRHEQVTAASPLNGMMGGTTTDAERTGKTTLPASNAALVTPAALPASMQEPANPIPAGGIPAEAAAPMRKDAPAEADDVPTGAEVGAEANAPASGNATGAAPGGMPAPQNQ